MPFNLKALFNRFSSRPTETRNPALETLGIGRRDTVIDPSSARTGFMSLRRPDEVSRTFGLQRVKLKDLLRLPVRDAISQLISSSDALSAAVDLYIDYTVQQYHLESDDDAARKIIEDFIELSTRGGHSFLTQLKDFAYGIYVEGGFCGELIFEEGGTQARKITPVSPFSLAFEKASDAVLGDYYLVGQYINQKEFRVLQDEANPNETFIYNPSNKRGNVPYGSSQVAPALFGVASMFDLIHMIMDFTQGQVFPKGIYQIDTKPLIDAGYRPEQVTELTRQAAEIVKNTLSASDITQDLVISTPLLYTLVGSMDKSNISGAEMILDILERMQQRGLKVPRVLFGGRRSSGGLNDNEARIEWLSFQKRLDTARAQITTPITQFFTVILRSQGNASTVNLVLDGKDSELARIDAEVFNTIMDGYTKMKNLEVISPSELRQKVIGGQTDFSDLDSKLPSDVTRSHTERGTP